MSGVRERLEAVGLSTDTAEQFMKLLVELDLLGEGQVSTLMTASETMDREGRERLAAVLYAHLVHWLGRFTYCNGHVKQNITLSSNVSITLINSSSSEQGVSPTHNGRGVLPCRHI